MATAFTEGTKVQVKDRAGVGYSYRGKVGVVLRPHPFASGAVIIDINGQPAAFEVANLDVVPKTAKERLEELQAQLTALQAEVEEEENKIVAKDLPVGSVVQLLVGLTRGGGNKSLLVKTSSNGWNMVKGNADDTVWIPRVYTNEYVQKWLDERVKRQAKVVADKG